MSFIRKKLIFLILYGIFILNILVQRIFHTKTEIHKAINQFHNSFFDIFFRFITHLGDGIFLIFLTLTFFLLKKRKIAINLLLSYLLTGIIVQILKKTFFHDSPRPKKYFEILGETLRVVENVEIHSFQSFPSGHSTTVFALATVLILFFENKISQFILGILAVTVAFSRVYLSQHFIEDIAAGSIIGISGAFLSYFLIEKFFPKKYL